MCNVILNYKDKYSAKLYNINFKNHKHMSILHLDSSQMRIL